MNQTIIQVKNIGKKYNITHQRGGYVALRDVFTNILKSPFSFLRSKAKQVVGLETKENFWALKDVSFKVEKGDVVGVIGSNGAGKSTLLKILSQITPPTTGEIKINGRVGSLLEVGTGFHPELSGRENIFLNGAILGMTQNEIAKKFDEIVAFAGIEKFLDTPVKHYSSGMYVRLAFSVAAHMEPDILIVDEVLAVGDAEFQKKCIGKMDEITKQEGRTILFVSHNMSAIQQLCNKTIVLKNGSIAFEGETTKAIEYYTNQSKNSTFDLAKSAKREDGRIRIESVWVENKHGDINDKIYSWEDIFLVLSYTCKNPEEIKKVDIGFALNKDGTKVTKIYGSQNDKYFKNISQSGQFKILIRKLPLNSGSYGLTIRIMADGVETYWVKGDIGSINVENQNHSELTGLNANDGLLLLDYEFVE